MDLINNYKSNSINKLKNFLRQLKISKLGFLNLNSHINIVTLLKILGFLKLCSFIFDHIYIVIFTFFTYSFHCLNFNYISRKSKVSTDNYTVQTSLNHFHINHLMNP